MPLRERERGQLQVEIGLLCGYISVLISEMRGHRMLVPLAPHIPSRDPPIHHQSTCLLLPNQPIVGDIPL